MVGEMMVTPSAEFDPAIFSCIEEAESGVISLEDVVSKITALCESKEFHLLAEDFEPTSPSNEQPKWMRNVRNRLLYFKLEGTLAHIGPNQYSLPIICAKGLEVKPELAWKKCAEVALFMKENQVPLVQTEKYNIFIRSVGSNSISLTKTSKEYDEIPVMEHYNGQISTFELNPPWIERAAICINAAGGFGHWKTINGNKKYIAQCIVELHPQLLFNDGNVLATQEIIEVETILDKFIPSDVIDDREPVETVEYRRIGQEQFRVNLLKIYSGKCAISGVNICGVLQAAHICPYIGSKSNHIQNGILLRSDFHLLFDNHQLTIDANSYTIRVAPELWESDYLQYNGKTISLSSDPRTRPSKTALKIHNSNYLNKNGGD
jgi:hypothetical protein